MKIIDNFIPPQSQDNLEKKVLDFLFPWHFASSSDLGSGNHSEWLASRRELFQDQNIIDPPQFFHSMLIGQQPTSTFALFTPLLNNLKYKNMRVLRMKMNLTYPVLGSTELSYGVPHVDLPYESDYMTLVYYVTDADGDTILFNERNGYAGKLSVQSRVQPKKGRIVIFDGNTLHAACPPVSNKTRVVVNINIRFDK